MIKIAFYGKSGSGKSTIAQVAREFFGSKNLDIEVIKLAEPLYLCSFIELTLQSVQWFC